MDIQLASRSPRRRALLTQIGVRFDTVDIDVSEIPASDEAPLDYVGRLAQEKARAGFAKNPTLPTLGADTIVVCDDLILEKPQNKQACLRMLSHLSGRVHQVMTAVSLVTHDAERHICVETDVHFHHIKEEEMEAYWASGEPCDKAGGYAIQGRGAVFVREIHGCYFSVVGLPLSAVARMLADIGVQCWQFDGLNRA